LTPALPCHNILSPGSLPEPIHAPVPHLDRERREAAGCQRLNVLGKLVNTFLPWVPRPLVGAVAQRYVAGEDIPAALGAISQLASEGALSTIDILGESVTDAAAATAATDLYLELLDALSGNPHKATVSIKLTMLGLSVSPELCTANVDSLYRRASAEGIHVTIDMEDSSTTDYTLALFADMQAKYMRAGCVLQAYMRRTMDDARALPANSNVRLCKGIYVEPEEIAYKGYQQVRDNYVAVLDYLISAGHYPCIATHDEWIIDRALELIERNACGRNTYEFQMLLGVKPQLRHRLTAAGHALRVYVPYGSDWYAYSIRRLRENPQVAVHVMKAMLGAR
jgi:proline dehydrogenase